MIVKVPKAKRAKGMIFVHRSLLSILLLMFPVFLPAQTAADLETVLQAPAITCEQAAWFTLAVALDEPPANPQAAFALALERGWLPAGARDTTPITCGGLAYLMMKAFDLTGGMMYRLTGNRRYAYREMKSRGYITGRVYSGLAVSGEQFLQILGNVTDDEGAAR